MPDNQTPQIIVQQTNWVSTAIGGGVAIVGGFLAVIIRLRLETKQEINYIKIGLTDELYEICSIIEKMSETFRTTHIISNTYLNELKTNTEAYTRHKPRLFLIKDDDLRKEISAFYKKLNKNINDSINTVGKLGETESGGEHNQIAGEFNTLRSEAADLKRKISTHKYCAFWVLY